MFLTFFPLIPLTLAGAILFRKKSLAYSFPVLLIVLKSFFTDFSLVYLFTLIPLLCAVFGMRYAVKHFGISLWKLAGYAFSGILMYELISTFGVWLLGNCLRGYTAFYPHTVTGLLQCYRASLPFTFIHFLRDIPLGVLLMQGALLLKPLSAPKGIPASCALKNAD